MSAFNTSSQQLLARATEFQRAGRWAEAIPLFEQALHANPTSLDLLIALATCEVTLERLESARRRLAHAMQLAPRDARPHLLMAYAAKREGKFDDAILSIDEAIRRDPNNAGHKASKAEILHMAGRTGEAYDIISSVLHHVPSVTSVAGVYATIAPKLKREKQAIPYLEQVLARTDLSPTSKIKYSFDLARLYDAVGEYSRAFNLYQRGNTLKAERWSADEWSRLTSAIIAAWSKDNVAALPRAAHDGSRMVFIVGMPRSGTSLVEQILSTSPGVFAAGERNELLRAAATVENKIAMGIPIVTSVEPLRSQDTVNRLSSEYLGSMARLAGSGATRITDKMPVNFANLGLVQTLLPGAKVIHCRRDAMDSCLSCYFQLFGGNLGFAYDLRSCGRFYVDYERLMAHWKSVLDLDILDLKYEELVADQEGMTRRIFEFAGLPFTDDALRFHESGRATLTASSQQVREPINTKGLARWKNYERFLEPLKTALGPYAV
jgi:tetratricopeptide (TPR) repeat protein